MAAAITMFTAERIVVSSRLGPTPNYQSTIHARVVDPKGPDAFIRHPRDDAVASRDRFLALLTHWGMAGATQCSRRARFLWAPWKTAGAGGVARQDVAGIVAHVEALFGSATCKLAGMKQRFGVRFAPVGGIPADDTGGSLIELQGLD